MKTCGTCRYFGREYMSGDYMIPTGYHPCAWVKQPDVNTPPETLAVVVDASHYYATLCVKEDFGCNQWTPKHE